MTAIKGASAYLVTEGEQNYLCVIDEVTGFHRFEIGLPTLARLNVESAERILTRIHGSFAQRIGAHPLDHKCVR